MPQRLVKLSAFVWPFTGMAPLHQARSDFMGVASASVKQEAVRAPEGFEYCGRLYTSTQLQLQRTRREQVQVMKPCNWANKKLLCHQSNPDKILLACSCLVHFAFISSAEASDGMGVMGRQTRMKKGGLARAATRLSFLSTRSFRLG